MLRGWLPRLINPLSTRHWRDDLHGGVAAAAVALPLALAFGVVSGAGPVAGVYGAICCGLFAALFGGTPTQISGPTGPMAIVMAGLFTQFAGQPTLAFTVVMLAGLLQILFGTLRLGRYIGLLPYSVSSGFANGVGCIIIIMQFNPMLGFPAAADTIAAARELPQHLAHPNQWALGVAALSLAGCYLLPARWTDWFPSHLIVLIGGTLLVAGTGLDVPRLGPPATLLPNWTLPQLSDAPWQPMVLAALVIALISSLDSLLTSVAADNATQRFHDAERELVGQGLGNLCAGLLGALPGAGATARTMANIRAGGRTPASGVSHSLILVVLLVVTGGLLRYIPQAVLAGILLRMGLGIIDWSYLKRLPTAPRTGILIMLTVWVLAVFVSVVTAVATGIIMASLVLVKRMADLQLEQVRLSSDPGSTPLTAAERDLFKKLGGRALLIHLAGPVTFGAANGLTRKLAPITQYEAVLLDMTEVPQIDSSAAIALDNIIRRARENNSTVILVGLKSRVVRAFARAGLLPLVRQCDRFRDRSSALRYAATVLGIQASPAPKPTSATH